MIIAIDGFSWTGKWTTAKWVAKLLGFLHVDTGSLYRWMAIHLDNQWVDRSNKNDMIEKALTADLSYSLNLDTDNYDIILNGNNIESEIRDIRVSTLIPKFVSVMEIRNHITHIVQNIPIIIECWLVVDGRDIGTHIFPDAELKVFLDCDLEIRVQRRCKQLELQWKSFSVSEIRENIIIRDQADYLWPHATNSKSWWAIVIDTSHTTIDEQISIIINQVESIKKLSS